MKSNIYSNLKLIGSAELQIIDESMGVVSGVFIPNDNYSIIRRIIWDFHKSSSERKYDELNKLRLNCQLENEVFLYAMGGFLITDLQESQQQELEFEAAGNYRHVIEDNFLTNPPKERIFEPWEFISIEQKIAYEDELFKEIGKAEKRGFLNLRKPKKHHLFDYEFSAIAKFGGNDNVLFAIENKDENKQAYAVINLTWKGRLEVNDTYPRTEFFEDFDHFLNYRLYPDKREWEL